jgi:hypothetical protein
MPREKIFMLARREASHKNANSSGFANDRRPTTINQRPATDHTKSGIIETFFPEG